METRHSLLPQMLAMFALSIWAGCIDTIPYASAETKTLELGALQPFPGTLLEPIVPKFTYITPKLINAVFSRDKPWFEFSDSTISLFLEFEPYGPQGVMKAKYNQVIQKVDEYIDGMDQNVPFTNVPFPIHDQYSNPILRAHIFEIERTPILGEYVKSLNQALGYIPNPYTTGAQAALNTANSIYDSLFVAWKQRSKVEIQLASAGFTHPVSRRQNDDYLAGPPFLGNLVYILLEHGNDTVGDIPMNQDWIRKNLELDSSGKRLVYKNPITINPGAFSRNIIKTPGDEFQERSYMLFMFQPVPSRFTSFQDNIDIQQDFEEARKGTNEFRLNKWAQIEKRLWDSKYFTSTDIIRLKDAYRQYINISMQTQECLSFLTFWERCFKNDPQLSLDLINTLSPGTSIGQPSEIKSNLLTLAAKKEWLENESRQMAARAIAERKEVQTELHRLGYFTGKVDGKWQPEMINAIGQFQANFNLEKTGTLNSDTYKLLRLDKYPAERQKYSP